MKTKELKEEIERLEKYMAKNPFYESYLDNRLDCLKAELKGRTEALKDVGKFWKKEESNYYNDKESIFDNIDEESLRLISDRFKQKIKEMEK